VDLRDVSPWAGPSRERRAAGAVQALWWAALVQIGVGAVGAGVRHKWVVFALIVAEWLGMLIVLILGTTDDERRDDALSDRAWFAAGLVLWLLWVVFSLGTAIVSLIGERWGQFAWGLAGVLWSCLLLGAAIVGAEIPEGAGSLVDDGKDLVDGVVHILDSGSH
jgi:hypothetical protein